MTQINTNELIGSTLDWAVAKCLGTLGHYVQPNDRRGTTKWEVIPQTRRYSTDWAKGGPIIEREKIGVECDDQAVWFASYDLSAETAWGATGPTPLIAAMRCYIASKLGDIVDVPDELKQVNP